MLLSIWICSATFWKDENKLKKRPGLAHFFQKKIQKKFLVRPNVPNYNNIDNYVQIYEYTHKYDKWKKVI